MAQIGSRDAHAVRAPGPRAIRATPKGRSTTRPASSRAMPWLFSSARGPSWIVQTWPRTSRARAPRLTVHARGGGSCRGTRPRKKCPRFAQWFSLSLHFQRTRSTSKLKSALNPLMDGCGTDVERPGT